MRFGTVGENRVDSIGSRRLVQGARTGQCTVSVPKIGSPRLHADSGQASAPIDDPSEGGPLSGCLSICAAIALMLSLRRILML